MKKWPGILFAIFMIFLFMEILVGFPIRLEHESESESANPPVKDEFTSNEKIATQQKMQGVHLVESRKGSRDWELFAGSAENSKGRGAWQLQKMKILFYNNEKVDFVVTGDKGDIDSESKNIRIEGNVITKSSNGYEFQTNSMIYYQALRVLDSPDDVKMLGPPDNHGQGIVLQGKKMEANIDATLMKIKENVKATKQLSDGNGKEKKFQIKSQSAEFSGQNRTADGRKPPHVPPRSYRKAAGAERRMLRSSGPPTRGCHWHGARSL